MHLTRLDSVRPTRAAAEEFGASLAALHDAGASAWGAPPEGWDGDGYLGPNDDLLPLPLHPHESWGAYLADECIAPTAEIAWSRGGLPGSARALVERVCERLHDGDFDDDAAPARIHGDLWSGNVVWAADGATLIDPAAHGGHRLTDLAMLELFGFPQLDVVFSAYAAAHPLPADWRDKVALHQLHHLLVHCACFGQSYAGQTVSVLRRYA